MHSNRAIGDDHRELKWDGSVWDGPAAHSGKVIQVVVLVQQYLILWVRKVTKVPAGSQSAAEKPKERWLYSGPVTASVKA
jgi:hypothetical protein